MTFGEYLNYPGRTFAPDDGTGWVRATVTPVGSPPAFFLCIRVK